jgi:hypothetical protein
VRRALLAAVLVFLGFGASDAHAEPPAWWQQFYVQFGYRASLGLDRMSNSSVGVGYRHERGPWALDVKAFDIQQGLDEGVHELGHVGIVRRQPLGSGTAWLSFGGGYSIARGWAECEIPLRRGHGAQLDLAIGYDVPISPSLRWFGKLGVAVPLYDLRDTYESDDSSTRIVPIDFALGARF